MAKLCKRCNQPIVLHPNDSIRRWQEAVQDYHSNPEVCIKVLGEHLTRIEERLDNLERFTRTAGDASYCDICRFTH